MKWHLNNLRNSMKCPEERAYYVICSGCDFHRPHFIQQYLQMQLRNSSETVQWLNVVCQREMNNFKGW